MGVLDQSKLRKLLQVCPTELPSILGHKWRRKWGSFIQRIQVTQVGSEGPRAKQLRSLEGLKESVKFFALTGVDSNPTTFAQILEHDLNVLPSAVCAKADRVLDHVFDLLGSGQVCLGKQIDWHRDFKSGVRWKSVYFSDIRTVNLYDESDIKVPWELSRFYHSVTLGKAYYLTGDEKYTQEFVSQFEDWRLHNKPYHGVNWRNAMEVGIRAIHWVWAYFFFRNSALFIPEVKRALATCLAVHGEYIAHNLEYNKTVYKKQFVRHNGNHYIADLVGLIFLGLVVPGKIASEWLRFALTELDKELEVQVLDDGVHWELSPSYHRLVLEMCLSAVILCRQNGVDIPPRMLTRLASMCDFVKAYTKPNGRCPNVRDADDGRLNWLNADEFNDHRHVLALGGVLFERPDLVALSDGRWEDVLWLMGPSGISKARDLSEAPPVLRSTAFRNAGYFVLRKDNHTHILVSAANVGMAGIHGAHSHNDCLSFELFSHGGSFIADRGTYCYGANSALRNELRSTGSHNTAKVDGLEINRFVPEQLFGMQNDARPEIASWRTTDEFDFLSALHHGYERLAKPVRHRRDFYLDKEVSVLIVRDAFEGEGKHLIEVFLHFYPGVEVEQKRQTVYAASHGLAEITINFMAEVPWHVAQVQSWLSERYGRKQEAAKLQISAHVNLPTQLTTMILLPSRQAEESNDAEAKERVEAALEAYYAIASSATELAVLAS